MIEKRYWHCKILFISIFDGEIYAGDALGNVILLKSPLFIPKILNNFGFPISGITKMNGDLYVSTWKGEIINVKSGDKIELGKNIIKACGTLKNHIVAGQDNNLFFINQSLRIVRKIECKNKIQSMNFDENSGAFGMSCGFLAVLNEDIENELEYKENCHEKSIVSIKIIENKLFTGDIEGNLAENNKILNQKNGWIRQIHNENLFIAGKNVFYNGNSLFEHEDDAMGVVETEDVIVSGGIDQKFFVFYKNPEILF